MNVKKKFNNINKVRDDTKSVKAYDGDGWGFVLYDEDKLIWERPIQYIYGIKPLEEIKDILLKK